MAAFTGEWEFYKDKEDKWHWRHSLESAKEEASTEVFATKADCVIDAKMHGYINPIDSFDLYHGHRE